MATSSSYYLNAPSLGSATAIFTDNALSICAPNGFYSNGTATFQVTGGAGQVTSSDPNGCI